MLLTALLLAAPLAAQSRDADLKRLTPLLPPPAATGKAADPAPAAPPAQPPQNPQQPGFEPPPQDVGTGPRLLDPAGLPFRTDRPLFLVDGIAITAFELNELVQYYRSFRPGSNDLLLIDAVAALLPMKVMQARFAAELEPMRLKMEAARAAVAAGRPFAEVVGEFSDDGEAEDPEGKYTFGRERAVQPFDRISFTTPPGAGLTGPWLTVYGWHLIEPLAYERGLTPQDDKTTMRHVLAMYPRLLEIERDGGDVRAWIREQVSAAKIRVLEPGLANLVPPERRSQITQ
jgi:hypothetical protein